MMVIQYLAILGCFLSLACALDPSEIDQIRDYGAITITEGRSKYIIRSDGLPDHEYGPFPSNHNPHTATVQDRFFRIPKVPKVANTPGCLPMGPIAVAINGVAMYNPYNSQGSNAVEGESQERFDMCNGHPDGSGTYHYHQTPNCLAQGREDQIIGIAIDGYPIYGPIDEFGNVLKSSDLDACHGREVGDSYRYHLTADFPYILGCFHGEAHSRNTNQCSYAISDDIETNFNARSNNVDSGENYTEFPDITEAPSAETEDDDSTEKLMEKLVHVLEEDAKIN